MERPAPARSWARARPMRHLHARSPKVAPSGASVLLLGRERHGQGAGRPRDPRGSPRRAGPFVAVNASALPERWPSPSSSATSGEPSPAPCRPGPGSSSSRRAARSFSTKWNAVARRAGEAACGPSSRREIERVGGRRSIPVDFRLVSATNEDLEARVAAGTLPRGSLLPDQRGADPHPAAARAGGRHPGSREALPGTVLRARHGRPAKSLSPGALAGLEAHPWRGNVRELEHVIELLVLFSEGRSRRKTTCRGRCGGPAGPERRRGAFRRGWRLSKEAPRRGDRRGRRRQGRSCPQARSRREPDEVPLQQVRPVIGRDMRNSTPVEKFTYPAASAIGWAAGKCKLSENDTSDSNYRHGIRLARHLPYGWRPGGNKNG